MLNSLKVSNYAIIDELEITFSDGFNIITGETGAGKSILIGALGLIMGNRADTKVLFDLHQKCVVEAEFQVGAYSLNNLFNDLEIDYDDHLVIRREIAPSGKTRAFINDTPANLKTLRDITEHLIDMHQQFDTLGINNPGIQLELLDAYSGNEGLLKEYQEKYFKLQSLKLSLAKLIREKEQAEKDQELLKYQLEEFEKLDLQTGLLAEWESELSVLENAESIKSILLKSAFALDQAEPSLLGHLGDISFELQKITGYHPDIEKLGDRYMSVLEELKDLAAEFERQGENTELDPERLITLQEKVNLAYQLQSKHRVTSEEELLLKWEEISNRIAGYQQSGADIIRLEGEIKTLLKTLGALAEELSNKRKKASIPLCQAVMTNLHQLSMENAVFEIKIEDSEDLHEKGKDKVTYLFAANKGSRLQEINEVASGGELSRLSLCIKTELAKNVKLPTLIFDEIDSGVSGAVSMKMGNLIKSLSASHQIINITHSPQIAAKADRHYRIFKINTDNRSFTRMEILNGEDKTFEIAKMLSGDPPSEAAIQNARALMSLDT